MKTTNILITMENGDTMSAELYPEIAPKTVENFVKLVNEKFYDGLIFHRVIPGFMIQGGDPQGTGMGGPGYSIVGEFSSNGFLIMHQDAPHLDGQYAAFGKLTDGFDTLDKIASTKTNWQDRPKEEQKIQSIVIQ